MRKGALNPGLLSLLSGDTGHGLQCPRPLTSPCPAVPHSQGSRHGLHSDNLGQPAGGQRSEAHRTEPAWACAALLGRHVYPRASLLRQVHRCILQRQVVTRCKAETCTAGAWAVVEAGLRQPYV